MRGFLSAIKAFFVTAVVIGCIAFVYAVTFCSVFKQGERHEFYTGTSSEEIVLSRSSTTKLFLKNIRGESVRYGGDKTEELLRRFGAQILFVEEVAGIVNYYCYSPELKNSVNLDGQKVNLHIACNGEETAAGTPVIFGGF